MAKKYLDYDGLLYFLQKIRPTTAPKMNGTAAVGTAKRFANEDHVHPSDTSRAPNDHASTATTYGKGTSSNYGHVKLSDVINGTSAASSGGTAATPKAVKDALDVAKAYADLLDTGVSDVTVDGTSVVTSGVAAIDLSGKVDKVSGKDLSTNDYTTTEKNKLSGIATGAEVNQNAFSNVKVGSTTVAADGKTDTLELAAGTNITLTPDATNDKVTIAFSGTIPTVPNNFGTVKVGSTSVVADSTSDTLELVAGSNITLTPDATNDKVTIAAQVPAEIFVATYGSTSYADIADAANNKKAVFVSAGDGLMAVMPTIAEDFILLAGLNGSASASSNTPFAVFFKVSSSNTWSMNNLMLARLASPAFGGTPTAPTAAAGTNTTQIATTAFVTSAIQTAQAGAATFQGTAPTTFTPTNYKKGYYWVIGTAGTYAGQTCEPGDMIFAIADYASSYAAADFNVIQTNLDITSITNAEIDTIVAT